MTWLFIIGALFYWSINNQVPNIHKLHGKPPFANETGMATAHTGTFVPFFDASATFFLADSVRTITF
jgi:hypothetical protein